MTSARELLEQADALMRRRQVADDDDVPVLDAVVEDRSTAADDVPVLTDAIEAVLNGALAAARSEDSDPQRLRPVERAPDLGRDDEPPPAPATTAPERLAESPAPAFAVELPSPQPLSALIPALEASPAGSPGVTAAKGRSPWGAAEDRAQWAVSEDQARSGSAGDQARWAALREQVYASVMQRLDVLTEQALKKKLAEEIRPIVERAGEELIARIVGELGILVRVCVAEAVEAEISAERDRQLRPGR